MQEVARGIEERLERPPDVAALHVLEVRRQLERGPRRLARGERARSPEQVGRALVEEGRDRRLGLAPERARVDDERIEGR